MAGHIQSFKKKKKKTLIDFSISLPKFNQITIITLNLHIQTLKEDRRRSETQKPRHSTLSCESPPQRIPGVLRDTVKSLADEMTQFSKENKTLKEPILHLQGRSKREPFFLGDPRTEG